MRVTLYHDYKFCYYYFFVARYSEQGNNLIRCVGCRSTCHLALTQAITVEPQYYSLVNEIVTAVQSL